MKKMTMDEFKERVGKKVSETILRVEPKKAQLSRIVKDASFEDFNEEELVCAAAEIWFEKAIELIEVDLQRMWKEEEKE